MVRTFNIETEESIEYNLRRLFVIAAFFFCVLFVRLFYLQVVKGYYFQSISEKNRVQSFSIKAPRGDIITNDGLVVVSNRSLNTVMLSKMNLSTSELKKTVGSVSRYIDIDPVVFEEDIKRLETHPFESIRLALDIPQEMLFQVKEHLPYLHGIRIASEYIRQYALRPVSSHVFGHLGEITKQELKYLNEEGYRIGDVLGKEGLEKVYDAYLRGADGFFQIEVDAKAHQRRMLLRVEPRPGNDIYVTIDSRLQREAEKAIDKKTGAIVALEPRTGRILAMVSSPGFDASRFLYPLFEERERILNDPSFPMLHRSIKSQHAPGSIFKLITTIAALEEKKVTPKERIKCESIFDIGERVFKCWKEKGHGTVSLKTAFAESCDVYYYNLGMRLGARVLARYARLFGMGEYTGIDLPWEKKGLIANRQWKRKRWKTEWYSGDTVNFSIGQGFLLATPIQMVNMLAAIVNNGYLYRPYVVDKIISSQKNVIFSNRPMVLRRIRMSKDTRDFVLDAMQEVVEKGTGRLSRIKGLQIGGKTGTSQNPHGEDHAWFVAAAPIRDAEIVVCVFIEHGGHGSSVAAPLARRMLKRYFDIKNKKEA